MTISIKQIVDAAYHAAEAKKARDITVLNISEISTLCDYFIICSGGSTPQVKAIAEHIEEKLAEQHVNPLRREGIREGDWVLLDYGDIVVHIFKDEERDFYNLERLWGDAKVVDIPIQ